MALPLLGRSRTESAGLSKEPLGAKRPKIAFLKGKRACFTEDPGEAWDLGNLVPPAACQSAV